MLILQRKAGQSFQIGEDIVISVVSIDNNRVRLSISAPNDVPILRSELVEAKLANQASIAAQAAPETLLSLLGTPPKKPESPSP